MSEIFLIDFQHNVIDHYDDTCFIFTIMYSVKPTEQ